MKNNLSITVSAPGKLLLLGDHAVVYGRPCIVTAVDKRMHLTLSAISEQQLVIDAPDVDVQGYSISLSNLQSSDIPKGAAFIVSALRQFISQYSIDGGVRVVTKSDFSSNYGFGSSSASVVCMIYALSQLYGYTLDNNAVFNLAYKAVLDVQGVGSGFDVASAIWGGTILFQSGPHVEFLALPQLPLIIGYTGIKADTSAIVRDVAKKWDTQKEKVERIFTAIETLVVDAKQKMLEDDWERVGKLASFNQEYLRDLGVSSEKLETLIHAAITAGAYGAKLSGAGGGDCMFAVSDANHASQIVSALEHAGGEVFVVGLGAPGVRRETTDNQSEMLIVVDEKDTIIEYRTRKECHTNPSLLHRTVGVILTNNAGELILQRRTLTKDMDAGLWGISAAGHVTKGQEDDEAAHRELHEEIGVDTDLSFVGTFFVKNELESERAALYKGVHNGPFTIDPDEVAEIICIDPATLKDRIEKGEMHFTEGARKALSLIGVLS